MTVKLKGEDDGGVLAVLKAMLAGAGAECVVRRLDANRNEVTAYGERMTDGAVGSVPDC